MVYHISPWPTYSEVAQLCPTLCEPRDCPWNSPGQDIGVGSLSLLQGIFPNPGIEPRSPKLQVDSLPAESQGKPKNAGVVGLSLLQQIFLTQELNWVLLHCRRILYQLSYQGRLVICNIMKLNNLPFFYEFPYVHFIFYFSCLWNSLSRNEYIHLPDRPSVKIFSQISNFECLRSQSSVVLSNS